MTDRTLADTARLAFDVLTAGNVGFAGIFTVDLPRLPQLAVNDARGNRVAPS